MKLSYSEILAKREVLRKEIDILNAVKYDELSNSQVEKLIKLVRKKKFMYNYWNNILKNLRRR